MLDSPQSQENITKHLSKLGQSIVTRKDYKKLIMLDSPQSQENITKS